MALLVMTLAPARAAVIYSGLQNIGIPTDFNGIYLDLDTGFTRTSESTGWDVNPFFGGLGVANSPAFRPARSGAGTSDPILGLGVGMPVDVARFFSPGYGGSQSHLGTQFTAGQEGYLGFKFTNNAATGTYYGWMRVIFTANAAGAVIKDWAYENAGIAIITARIVQSAASAGAQVVTLSPGSGESFTLGSALTNTGGNINSLVKTGLGTAILTTASNYTGGTTVTGGMLRVNADAALGATGGVTINSGATLQAGSTLTSSRVFTIGSGGGKIDTNGQTVTLAAVTGSTLTKLGTGTLNLNGAQNYRALTTNAGTTNVNGSFTGGTATVNANATTNFWASQTLAALNIGDGAEVTFNESPQNFTYNGSGTLTLTGFLNYATLTTNSGVLNVNGVIGTGSSTVNANATLNFGASQTLAALNIGPGVEVTFGSGLPLAMVLPGDGVLPDVVPEPGTLGLLIVGALGVFGCRPKHA